MQADDYFAIQNLINRYFQLVDEADFENCAELFADADMVYRASGQIISKDPKKIAEVMRSYVRLHGEEEKTLTRHHSGNVCIHDSGDDKARATSSAIIFQATPILPLQAIAEASYTDEFAKIDGAWRFTRREMGMTLMGDLNHHLQRA